jgi:hypothetical protein
MVMIEYQLVPLFQSIGSETQLTNSSVVDFQIELSDPFPNFSASHIEIVGDPGTCQTGTLSGSGTSLLYTVTDCVDGQVGISIPANSIAAQGYSGPETTQSSAMVFVDRTAPEVLEITQQDSELIIPITEPVLQPETDSYSFTSSKSACQLDSVTASSTDWLRGFKFYLYNPCQFGCRFSWEHRPRSGQLFCGCGSRASCFSLAASDPQLAKPFKFLGGTCQRAVGSRGNAGKSTQ